VIEALLREAPPGLVQAVRELPGILGANTSPDGLLTRLTVQARPEANARAAVLALVAEEQLESVLEREPTLEEAYLSILG
jgi:hypothetical protein